MRKSFPAQVPFFNREREQSVLCQSSLDLNSELFIEAVVKGTDLLERGVADYSNWSRAMVYWFGEPVRPHVERIWGASQDEWQRRQAANPPSSQIAQLNPGASEPPPLPKRSNYLVRHWRGELPLPVSYWVNGILGGVLVAILSGAVSASDAAGGLKAAVAATILLYAIGFAVSIWQMVGTWRSASNHAERGGSSVWAGLAKVVLVLGTVNLVRITAFTTVPQIVEYANILAGDTKLPPYEIRVLPGGREVEFSGGIRAGSEKELERIVSAMPQLKVLHVNSVGGRIREAERMAELVRKKGLTTYTSDQCLSAATLVFIAGKERVVASRAKIGFHQGWFPGMTEHQRRVSDEALRKTMLQAGVSDEFITHVLATSHESMWYPTKQEMRKAGVITSESFGERFVVSGALLRSSSPEDIDKAWGALPGFRAIKEVEPDTYWAMANAVSDAIQSGKTVLDAQKIVRATSEPLVMKYLPAASDEALRATRDGWVELLERFKDSDSEACIAMFSPKSAPADFNYARIPSGWNNTNNFAVLEQVLRSAARGTKPQLDAVEAEKDLNSIRLMLRRNFGRDVELLANENDWMAHSDRLCEMLLNLYRETQNIPQPRQGNLLRYMLFNVSPSSSRSQQAGVKNADPSGTWTWSTMGRDGGPERKSFLRLKLEEERVEGTLSAPGPDGQSLDGSISDGQLKGEQLSFAVTLEFQENKYPAKFNGTIRGDSINGKIEIVRNGQLLSRDWQAKRVASYETPPSSGYAGTDPVLLSDRELQRFVPPGFKGDRFDLMRQYPEWAGAMNQFVTQRATQQAHKEKLLR